MTNLALTFKEVQTWLIEHGAMISGSRLRGCAREDSDWDYWIKAKHVKAYAIYLSNNEQCWEPFT